MKRTCTLGAAALMILGARPVLAQANISGSVQLWYTQMTDNNLRRNSAAPGGYFNLRSEFKENTFTVRRSELKISGKAMDGLEYEVMVDPSINTAATNPTILQDAFLVWKPGAGFSLKAGQMKTLQTYEGAGSSSELLFAERSQLGRVFGDKRDRGIVAAQEFGQPADFATKISVGLFNGQSDLVSGKSTDNNAQKDFVGRVDFTFEKIHKFGFYTLQGGTDQADKGKMIALPFAGTSAPATADVLDNKDKLSNLGAFYVFQTDSWVLSAEYITGTLGRRFASVWTVNADGTTTAPTAAKREHLDQKFVGYYVTGGYTTGNHSFLLRYDVLNYNSGDKWYTSYNPYTQKADGSALGADYTPKFTEITAGYTYAWKPEKVKAANFKLNYIARSKNFLKPNTAAGQTGEQGGNTIVAALQIAF